MTTKDFPAYTTPDVVRCWKCGRKTFRTGTEMLGRPTDSGYPPGGGQYQQLCECGRLTFYDLTD